MFIRIATLLTLIATLFAPAAAMAQLEWGQEYANRIKTRETVAALGPDLFGEQINLFDGTASFSATDIDIPGNNGLPVRVSRSLSIGSSNNAAMESPFGDWELSIPYLSNVSVTSSGWQAPPDPAYYWLGAGPALSYARCSAPAGTPEIPNTLVNAGSGGGEILQLNANTSPKLVRPTMPGVQWVTKGFWYLGCHPTLASGHPGEGFWAVDPAGNKYTFNWMVRSFYPGFSTPAIQAGSQLIHNRSELRLYPTRVEDRFGNWVQYNWQGRKLLSIVASDGRRVDFVYGNDDQILTATAHGKTWTYTYNDAPSPGVGGQLTAVTNPDGSTWTYGQNPGPYVMYQPQYRIEWFTTPGGDRATREVEVLEKVTFCSFDHYLSPQVVPFEIRHPSGARGVFSFKTMRHGRTHVPGECQFSWDSNDSSTREEQNNHNLYPAFKDVWSLQSKLVDGPGLTAATWQYRYDNLQACIEAWRCANSGTPTRKIVTVTQPDGDATVSTFGKIYGEDEGQLLSVEVRRGTTVVSRTDHTYVTNAEAALMPFPDVIGESLTEYTDPFSTTALRPMRGTLRTQDGNQFGDAVNNYDAFANPLSVSKTNNLGYAKTDVTDYQHDLAKWVIGAVKRQYNADTSMVMSETEFNAQLQPWKTYKFGKLQHILSYWPDGSINTVTDGRGNTTWIGDYHRGIPRLIGYPSTAEAPQGATESATVSDLGWITSLTDETGAKTCYDYDAMGRLSTILYPSETQTGVCDASRWHPASLSFQRVGYDEHGLPAGHWRASRYEGNKHVNTYYDAMWRPVLEEALDATDIGGTLSQTVKRYDSDGRISFQSYPQRGVGNYWDVTQGARTTYDALGRAVRVEQDSEHGALVTTTEYLPGLQVRVTNPRGLQTTTGFMAWDAPGYDLPLWSSQPEGKLIEIARHPRFGWPLQLKQRSADNSVQQVRSYVYDGHAQLCKTIEPETGATVVGYDAANNPVWSASGLTGGNYASTADCSQSAATTSGRAVTRQYDARNRLTALLFPDGRGNQVWTYEKDGLPKDITTFNDPNNTTPVVNGYAYNKRRMLTNEYSHQPGWYTWNIGYGYDAIGNLASQSYPTGLNIDYAPNALGQATRAGTYATGAQYYPNGAIKQFAYGNGIVHTMSQNARQLPERVISSGGVLDYQNYYDRNGNIEHIANNLGAGWDPRDRWMQYDGLDRLTAAGSGSFGGDHWHRYTYDALDNLKSWKLAGVKDYADYVYDASNRLTNIRNTAGATVVGLSYDAQGNLQNKNGQTYEFDFGNRLRGATGKEYYRYDGLGRRVLNWRYPTAATPNGTLSLSMYSQSGQLLMQWDDQYPKYSENIYLAGSVVAIRDIAHPTGAVTVKYQHTDALGSPVAVTNQAGAVIERNDYEPYGAIINKPNYNGMGYTGHMMDGATGLTYMQQRYYDQSVGRFLSIDPVLADGNNGSHFNRYWYADGNPYKYIDPDGRDTYIVNRDLRAWADIKGFLGGNGRPGSKSRNNPATHTFVVTTNKDGTIKATYSWGNDSNVNGWSKDQKIDIGAAREALRNGSAERVGDASLDPFVESAYDTLNKPENEHNNGIVTNNCKTEANNLIDTAKDQRKQAQEKSSQNKQTGFKGTFRAESRAESRQLDRKTR